MADKYRIPAYEICVWDCMNGTKPKFITGKVESGYFEKPDPYVNAPPCHVNLLELSRYAKKHGKKLTDLTKEEVSRYSI